MAKSGNFKWCVLIVACIALYAYQSGDRQSKNASPFGNAKVLNDPIDQTQPQDGLYTAVPTRDVNSLDQDFLDARVPGTLERSVERQEYLSQDSHMEMSDDLDLQAPVFDDFAEEEQQPIERSEDELFEFENSELPMASELPPSQPSPNQEVTTAQQRVSLPQGVKTKVIHHIEYGKSLARRGAVFGAKNEFHSALRLVAQAVDYQSQSENYSDSLYKAMVALKEADDFFIAQGENNGRVDVEAIAKHHESKILSTSQMRELSPVAAMQEYYNFIQKNFALAGGKSVVASEAMFCLGKLYLMKGKDIVEGSPLDNAKAIVHHRAALDCSEQNYKSANELAVLLAKTGRFEQAKNLLVHSLKIQQVPQAWENLSFIHRQLGENDYANRAFAEYQRMLNAPPTTQQINWVSPEQFAAQSSEPVALRTAMNPQQVNENSSSPQKQSSFKKILNKVF